MQKKKTFNKKTNYYLNLPPFFFRKLSTLFNYIDPDHVGIWGWSYGGYAAAMALANDEAKVFKCAASIAPVTDWAYYGGSNATLKHLT